jgi:hypothetical protein
MSPEGDVREDEVEFGGEVLTSGQRAKFTAMLAKDSTEGREHTPIMFVPPKPFVSMENPLVNFTGGYLRNGIMNISPLVHTSPILNATLFIGEKDMARVNRQMAVQFHIDWDLMYKLIYEMALIKAKQDRGFQVADHELWNEDNFAIGRQLEALRDAIDR